MLGRKSGFFFFVPEKPSEETSNGRLQGLTLALDTSSFNSLLSVNTVFPGSSRGEVSIYNAGDLSLIPK